MIPYKIHQIWFYSEGTEMPPNHKAYQKKLVDLHPEWEYKLWTTQDGEQFIRTEYPDFYSIFFSMPKNIMRADVFRYLLMYRLGGMYLDVDYEMVKPFDLNMYHCVLPLNRSIASGDKIDSLGNCIFASEPRHPYWKLIIDDLQSNPPIEQRDYDVIAATGPGFLTRIYASAARENLDIYLAPRIYFHPPYQKNPKKQQKLRDAGIAYGIHHCYGTWRNKSILKRAYRKFKRIFE